MKWHKGPPPHVGWWPASVCRNPRLWRWWNGTFWSAPTRQKNGAEHAARMASRKAAFAQDDIEWSDYYPPNARVPRVDPGVMK